jgi:16S rRNA (guanine527-N7)-methyltransferase
MTRAGPAPRALERVVAAHDLSRNAADSLTALVDLLATDPLAPTTVRDPQAVVDDHIADSLVALELPQVRDAQAIADLGSGAGIPALPLAIALPEARVCAVESVARKGEFIARAALACAVSNLSVVVARAEAWPDGLGRCDLVTARALAPLDIVAEYAAPLLRIGGALIAWRGRRDPEGEAAAARAAERLGLAIGEIRTVHPYRAAEHRHLHVLTKVAPTPAEFPRRPGVARKRPLGTIVTPSDRDRR